MRHRVHVFGASGAGTSTLGREIAHRFGLHFFDADDFFWQPTDPPFRHQRERAVRRSLMLNALSAANSWVLAGSICGWGDEAMDLFSLAVLVEANTEVRLQRLRTREEARFGDRISATGDMHQQHQAFLVWATQYDDGGLDMRSRRLHEEWLHRLQCPVLRLDGSKEVEMLVDEVATAMIA